MWEIFKGDKVGVEKVKEAVLVGVCCREIVGLIVGGLCWTQGGRSWKAGFQFIGVKSLMITKPPVVYPS